MNPTTDRKLFDHNTRAHDGVADIYDAKHVEIFNAVEQRRLEATVRELVATCGIASPEALDVGAGTGNLSLKLLAAGCRVQAADVSAKSLARLAGKAGGAAPLTTTVLTGERLPFADASFDIVGTYSVLHHIPDYLLTVREMARVLRPGGVLYVDHERNAASWNPDPVLAEYWALTRLPVGEHLWNLLRSGEAFTPAFVKTAFMKAFVDRRYEREGDIHVWADDHIEWDRIAAALGEAGVAIIRSEEYLHYKPRGGEALHERFRGRCADMRFVFARKRG
jgi:ubiquinone/menaquinone biosynthesis C-methylase UbiE